MSQNIDFTTLDYTPPIGAKYIDWFGGYWKVVGTHYLKWERYTNRWTVKSYIPRGLRDINVFKGN